MTKKLKQTNANAHLIQYKFKIGEGSQEESGDYGGKNL